jgi:ABC-type polar amino acid transport system ATPase subunit
MKDKILLKIKNLKKDYEDTEVLKGINLDVYEQEVLVIIGPSGSGKSTMLKCIDLLEDYQEGEIYLEGKLMGKKIINGKLVKESEKKINKMRSEVGMVFQSFFLFPHLNVKENIMLAPRKVKNIPRKLAEEKANYLLNKIGLIEEADSYPEQLSGGQQQRVAIARALAMEPKLMLFDEVTSALDPNLVGEVLDLMKNLAREGMTMIVVTHEIGFAREVADNIAYVNKGIIIERGNPEEIINNPKNEMTKKFLSRVI